MDVSSSEDGDRCVSKSKKDVPGSALCSRLERIILGGSGEEAADPAAPPDAGIVLSSGRGNKHSSMMAWPWSYVRRGMSDPRRNRALMTWSWRKSSRAAGIGGNASRITRSASSGGGGRSREGGRDRPRGTLSSCKCDSDREAVIDAGWVSVVVG